MISAPVALRQGYCLARFDSDFDPQQGLIGANTASLGIWVATDL